jgi:hypothetical protein
MRRIAESRELVVTLGMHARVFAESFTWERAADQTERHLLNIVGRTGGPDR